METSNVAVVKKLFCTERVLQQNCRITNCQGNLNTQPTDPKPPNKPENIIEKSTYRWGEYINKQFEENGSSIYEKIVYWKKNIFLLPTGKGGRCVKDETIGRIGNRFTAEKYRIKAIMIMPSLLLQKTSKYSKAKDYTKALEDLLENRLTFFMKIKHSTFLFKIIFLKKRTVCFHKFIKESF